MGVEGFDAFAYGAEDFFENVKNFFKMIAAAFKKLIQTVTNFCKMVINWVRGQVVKTQTKFYTDNKDKIKNMTDESKGKLVKVRVPNKEGPKAVANSFMKPIKNYNDSVDKHLNEALKINVFGEGVSGITGAKTYTGINRVTNSTHEFNPDVYLEFDYKDKKINITSKTKPADVGAYLVFGDNKKKEMRPAAFIKGIGGEAGIASYLSEDALKIMNAFNKEGNELIKDFNKVLKQLNNISKEMLADEKEAAWDKNNMDADNKADRNKSEYKSAKKDAAKAFKERKRALRDISLIRNVGGKLTGILLSAYSNLLSARSYCVSAIKAYGSNSERQKEKDKKRAENKKLLGIN